MRLIGGRFFKWASCRLVLVKKENSATFEITYLKNYFIYLILLRESDLTKLMFLLCKLLAKFQSRAFVVVLRTC